MKGPLIEMRLLNVHSMKLEEYFGFQIPEYAILSHCVRSLYILHPYLDRIFFEEKRADGIIFKWGAEEVTFQHINGSEWRGMRGAKKIKYAGSYCKEKQIDYIWIDTCCIDKSSSAELSEAINSMYGWYEGSIICYAYLEDVEHASGTHAADDLANRDKVMRKSRWFKRGWTLQELIAPKKVDFFDSEWRSLGTKEELSSLLSSITAIPEDVLEEPENRRRCSVARKMTWAAKRQTTRIEDVAYSLLGIFDVNMPLLYGEGRKAFIRLQEEILKDTDDQSLLAWGLVPNYDDFDPLEIITGAFANSPEDFLGSEDVVPFPSKPETQPQSMTSRGVRIEVPLWSYPSEELFLHGGPIAVLNCQYKDDFSGAIGIRLTPTGDNSIFLRSTFQKGIKCPVLEFKDHEIRTVYISKCSPAAVKYERRKTCIIRASSAEDNGYDFFPIGSSTSLWNEKTRVLQMGYSHGREWSQEISSISIAFYNPKTKSCFIIVIAITRKVADFQVETRTLTKIFAGPDGADRLNLEEWDREGQHNYSKVGWKDDDMIVLPNPFINLSGHMTVSSRITEQEILNQKLFVLDVTLL